MSGVINVLFHTRCDQCLVWSMSFFTHSVINVWCDQCPVWWISGVINVWCDQCPISHTVWSMSGVINVRCDQCPFIHTVWSMSGVINVWCDQCPILHTVWSMSGVINVWCDQCLCDQCRTIYLGICKGWYWLKYQGKELSDWPGSGFCTSYNTIGQLHNQNTDIAQVLSNIKN